MASLKGPGAPQTHDGQSSSLWAVLCHCHTLLLYLSDPLAFDSLLTQAPLSA